MTPSSGQPVYLTGIGAITPFAYGWGDVYRQACAGNAFMAPWAAELDPPVANARLGLVKEFPKQRFCTERQLRLMDRAMALSVTATGLAFENAGLTEDALEELGDGVATVFGSMRGELPSLYRFIAPVVDEGAATVNPAHFPMVAPNLACGQVALRFGLRGWSSVISCGEASGIHALARAVSLVASGRAPIAVVGAYEVLSKILLHHIKARWRKFSRTDLFAGVTNADVPVEGACCFVIESADSAARRGAVPYARLGPASHGFLHDADESGCRRILERHAAKTSSDSRSDPELLVSGMGASGGAAPDREARLLRCARARFAEATEMRTRPVFGDAGAQSILFQVACAAQALRDQKLEQEFRLPTTAGDRGDADRTFSGALVTQLTDRGAYGLMTVERAEHDMNAEAP